MTAGIRWNGQVFAGTGHVVVAVNTPARPDSGSASRDDHHALRREEMADVEAATDFLLRKGYIDRDRWWRPAAATAASWWPT